MADSLKKLEADLAAARKAKEKAAAAVEVARKKILTIKAVIAAHTETGD
jgi:hypothetical protein